MKVITIAALACLLVTSARGEVPGAQTAGQWSVTTDRGEFADVGTSPSGSIAIRLKARSRHFTLDVAKGAWIAPIGGRVNATFSFAGGQAFSFSGFLNGTRAEFALPDEQVRAFTHYLTAMSILAVSFPDTGDSPVTVSLGGTTATVTAMAQAIEIAGITGLPDPWNPAVAAAPAAPTSSPQPLAPPTQHAECVQEGLPRVVNGVLSPFADEQRQRDCELGFVQRAQQARLDEQARVRAAADLAEKVRLQREAELSTANFCRDPKVAGTMIEEFNRMDGNRMSGRKAVDIEHLTTSYRDEANMRIVCHGTFLTTRGFRLSGTFEMRPNVAGDMIVLWNAD